jgi:hypothetical protein
LPRHYCWTPRHFLPPDLPASWPLRRLAVQLLELLLPIAPRPAALCPAMTDWEMLRQGKLRYGK